MVRPGNTTCWSRSTGQGHAPNQDLNITHEVVSKTLDGLCYELGQKERKIRKDPAAQTTNLLREVFRR